MMCYLRLLLKLFLFCVKETVNGIDIALVIDLFCLCCCYLHSIALPLCVALWVLQNVVVTAIGYFVCVIVVGFDRDPMCACMC